MDEADRKSQLLAALPHLSNAGGILRPCSILAVCLLELLEMGFRPSIEKILSFMPQYASALLAARPLLE